MEEAIRHRASRLIACWGEAWNIEGLDRRIEVEISPRLRRSLGRCRPDRGLVRIARAVVDGPGELYEEVLCHEAAHVAVFVLHGLGPKPHGREWRRLMERAGFLPRVRIPETSLPEAIRRVSQPRVVYLHTCPVCHASRTARRSVPRWRCAACAEAGLDGRLEIVSRPIGAPCVG